MVTEKQAKEGQIWAATKATEKAEYQWLLVVNKLKMEIDEILRNIQAIIYRDGHWANHNDKIDEILLYIDTIRDPQLKGVSNE